MRFLSLFLAVPPAIRRRRARAVGRWGWLGDPRSAVLVVLGAVFLLGGGRRWLLALRARRALDRAADPHVTAEEVTDLATHGRSAVMDLFRIQGTAADSSLREAAGRGLASLWARDQLVAEEEKAIVTRGFIATWQARRRYPRALRGPIPIAVDYGIPFLREHPDEVGPANLEWSHRILGSERASLEIFSPWTPGPGRVVFALEPGDFPANGPHRLVLQVRVRTRSLTSHWELDLPHVPFSFEFDPVLRVEALLTLPDAHREGVFARAARLVLTASDEPSHLVLNDRWALREPPVLAVTTPLPCDLAHRLSLEFEGLDKVVSAGSITLSGQGGTAPEHQEGVRTFALGRLQPLGEVTFDRPGAHRVRAVLTADPDLGWADPDVRSVWPGTITTDWCTVRVVRL